MVEGSLCQTSCVVYVHLLPDGTPFYVGWGKPTRPYEFAFNRRSKFWGAVVKKHYPTTLTPMVELIGEGLSMDEAKNLEILSIGIFGRRNKNTGPLVNLTDGGDGQHGIIRSAETRKLMSILRSGKNHPLWGRFGKNNPRFGKPMSEQTKQHLREINLGSKNPNYGKERTLESRIRSANSCRTNKYNYQRPADSFNDNIFVIKPGCKIYEVMSTVDGVIEKFTNQTGFAKKYNLSQQSVNRLLSGERKKYLNWVVVSIKNAEN